MITDEMKDFLAKENGLAHERYIDRVNEEGKKKYTHEEENARLRKAVKLLANFVAISHPEIIYMPEYQELVEYYDDFEAIKNEVKAQLKLLQ